VSEYLTQNDAVPNDFDTMVFDVMKTATTVEFQDEIKMLAFARKREGNKRSADSILDELQTLYHNLVTSKKWTPLENKALLQSITLRVRVGTVPRRDMLSHNVQIQRTKVRFRKPEMISSTQETRRDQREEKETTKTSKLLKESLQKMVSLTKRKSAQGCLIGAALAESGPVIVPRNMATIIVLPKQR